MTSLKKIQANRRNALKSTGPKTPERKDTARLNALKHGLLSQEVLLPREDEAALKELGERLRAELQPVGELEGQLVERIVATQWRLRRLNRVEAGLFAWDRRRDEAAEERNREVSSIIDTLFPSSAEPPPPEAPEHLPEHPEVLSEAERAKSRQEDETVSLGRTFIQDAHKANAFSKLSRYETAIDRSLYKAVHELQRLQAARRAEGNVIPPVAVDVDVSGLSTEEL